MEQLFQIFELCREAGENKVDFRPTYSLIAATQEGRLHTLIDDATGKMIGCVSIYPYLAGDQQLNEIGTLVLLPDYRGRGIADFMVYLSALQAMLVDPGSICVSELYEDSLKAKRLLERLGMRQVVPCEFRRAHAESSTTRPVLHLELGDGPVPDWAGKLREWITAGMTATDGLRVRFLLGEGYWFDTEPGLEVLRRLSFGDLSAIRRDGDEDSLGNHGGPPPPKPPRGRGKRPH